MLRRSILLLFLSAFFITATKAQTISRIVVDPLLVNTRTSPVRFIEFFEKDVIIRVNASGDVRVQPLRGVRTEYYGRYDGDQRRGKLKRAGNTIIEYYTNLNNDNEVGKPKQVGDLELTYINKFGSFDNVGKLKAIGNISVKYIDRFDGFDTPRGLIKAIGDMPVTYYTKFDGFDNIGRIKKVGDAEFTYFDRFSTGERVGDIKKITSEKNPYLELAGERYH